MPTTARRTAKRIFPLPEAELLRLDGSEQFAIAIRTAENSINLTVTEKGKAFLDRLASAVAEHTTPDKIAQIHLPNELTRQARSNFIASASRKFPSASFPNARLDQQTLSAIP